MEFNPNTSSPEELEAQIAHTNEIIVTTVKALASPRLPKEDREHIKSSQEFFLERSDALEVRRQQLARRALQSA